MSQELPRSWVLPLLLAAVQPAAATSPRAESPAPLAEQEAGTASGPTLLVDPAPSALPGPAAEFETRRIGHWRLVHELGRGGMGTVYLGESTEPPFRRAAVKVIRADRVGAPTLARFATELQAMADADHEHVVRLYESGMTAHGEPWLAMEFVPGEPITSYCDRRALDVAARLQLMIDVGLAVQHLHERGMRHGDLKPEHILVVERAGRAVPKILDFGLAAVRGLPPVDEEAVAGTVAYMAPEQFTLPAGELDARCDVYALGVVLHEVLTGSAPGRGAATGSGELPGFVIGRDSAAAIDRRLPPGLARVLRRALAPQRQTRTASARELVAALGRELDRQTAMRQALRSGGLALIAALAGVLATWLLVT